MKTWLLNNCQNLDHAKVYGRPDAFYDLWARGLEDRKANDMGLGDMCVVLSQTEEGGIAIHEHILIQVVGDTVRNDPTHVLCGRFVRGLTMTRAEAEAHPVYRYFFNDIGHLCQWSAIRFITPETEVV